ncbi:MAG: LysO family transporter [Bacteroidota bacterium]
MVIAILLLFIGFLTGMFLRKKQSLKKAATLLLSFSIYLLLFFMGMNVGASDEIIQGFFQLGEIALVLTIFVIAGSIFISWIIYRFFFRETTSNKS